MKVKSESEVAQSCLTLCDPMDCSPPGSSIHGIFKAKVLEWGAIAYMPFHKQIDIHPSRLSQESFSLRSLFWTVQSFILLYSINFIALTLKNKLSTNVSSLPHYIVNSESEYQFSSVQSLSCVWLFVTPWIAACQASLCITNSWSSLRLTSIDSVMPSSHLILCCPLLLLPPIPPSMSLFQWVNSSHEVAKGLEFQL